MSDPVALLKERVILLAGEENALRRRMLTALLSTAGVGGDDLNLETFEAGTSSPQAWLAAAGTVPFLGDRRIVIIRNLTRTSPDDLRPDLLKSLPDTAFLLLVADDEMADESRQRTLATNRRKWSELVSAGGGKVLTFEREGRDVPGQIRLALAEAGKEITPKAMQALMESSEGLSGALDEVEKLIAFVGEAKQVRETDVTAVVVPSKEWNVFKLVDAALSGQPAEALRQLSLLIGTKAKATDFAFSSIFPNLTKTLRLLWQARVLIEASGTPAAVPETVRPFMSDRPNLLKERDFVQGKVMRLARNVTLDQIGACFTALSTAECEMKGLQPGYSPTESLEKMALTLAQIVRVTAPSVR